MRLFHRRTNRVCVDMHDGILRLIIGKDLERAQLVEVPLDQTIVEGGLLLDDMAFYQLLKEHLIDWGGKRQKVRFFAPDSLVMMKNFEHDPSLSAHELKRFVELEIGRQIHLPFEDPILDIHDPVEGDGEAILFAVPENELKKIATVFVDVSWQPESVDIRMLSNLRFLQAIGLLNDEESFVVMDWATHCLSTCIYAEGKIELLRYGTIEQGAGSWQRIVDEQEQEVQVTYEGDEEDIKIHLVDPITELERVLNFYRFSLYKGEKSVQKIITMGTHPYLTYITEELASAYELPVTAVDDERVQRHYPNFKTKHASLIGLMLKGAHK